jgi:hypothetical protein
MSTFQYTKKKDNWQIKLIFSIEFNNIVDEKSYGKSRKFSLVRQATL